MYYSRRKALSQNFLHNRTLVHKLVRESSIGSQDHVIEIGPGKGIITEELARVAGSVTAIEIDNALLPRLHNLFSSNNSVKIIHGDFLAYSLPKNPYKVFANIPFSIEGKIIRKLLDAPLPPLDCYLVMRHDFASRFIPQQKSTLLSISYAPWFVFEIVHYFKRTDYTPHARMSTVLLRVKQKEDPLIPNNERASFHTFIQQGFANGKPVRHTLSTWFSRQELDTLANRLHFSPKQTPSNLCIAQWIELFKLL
ncbi:23S ribosomal RNA methyltransferase Erm [Candidatus Woesebacteria bacterium]|nr:23S ribosomal RNA methyltransferase Erm [Candidatus Woesebacteria bacterium]